MSSHLTFAQRLLLLRKEMQLSQTQFAELLHIGRSWMSQLEKGEEPSPMLLSLFDRIDQEWRENHNRVLTEGSTPEHFGRGRLKAAREAKGLSQKQLAKAVGYSLGVYQGIEEGTSRMGRKQAEKVAEALGIDPEELLQGSDHPPEQGGVYGSFGEIPRIKVPKGMKVKYVPLISMAECGPRMAWDDGAYTGEGFAVFDGQDPNAFAVKLSGESMTPVYGPGDVAVVYPSHQPRNGDVVIARLDDEHGADVMFKVYQASSDTITLSSYNPAYEPIKWPRKCFTWIYPVAQVMKTLRPLSA